MTSSRDPLSSDTRLGRLLPGTIPSEVRFLCLDDSLFITSISPFHSYLLLYKFSRLLPQFSWCLGDFIYRFFEFVSLSVLQDRFPWPSILPYPVLVIVCKMDEHSALLSTCCRIGDKKFANMAVSTKYNVKDYARSIQAVYEVDISQDDPAIHPTHICHVCKRVLDRCLSAGSLDSFVGGGCGAIKVWKPHHRTYCDICHTAPNKGGRPPKKQKQLASKLSAVEKRKKEMDDTTVPQHSSTTATPLSHSPGPQTAHSTSGMDIVIEEVYIVATDTQRHRASRALTRDRFIDQSVAEECPLCGYALDSVVESACCHAMFCATCICTWLQSNGTCPVCSSVLLASEARKAEEEVVTITDKLHSLQQQLQYTVLFTSAQLNTSAAAVEIVTEHLQAQWKDADARRAELAEKLKSAMERINVIERSKNFEGPCLDNIEPILQEQGTERQAHHGGAFVGNHVHKALQPPTVLAIVSAPVSVVVERCPSLLPEANRIKDTYKQLFDQYASYTEQFSHCNSMDA